MLDKPRIPYHTPPIATLGYGAQHVSQGTLDLKESNDLPEFPRLSTEHRYNGPGAQGHLISSAQGHKGLQESEVSLVITVTFKSKS